MSAAILAGVDWLPLIASLALKATVVLAVAAGAATLLWRASAAVRHTVWFAGVIGVLALPLFAVVLPAWELPLLPVSTPSITWKPAPPALDVSAASHAPAVETSVLVSERGAGRALVEPRRAVSDSPAASLPRRRRAPSS